MNSCYVAIPFGVKSDATGAMIDFDAIFSEVIRPAVEQAGLGCLRLQDMPCGVLWQKELFSAPNRGSDPRTQASITDEI